MSIETTTTTESHGFTRQHKVDMMFWCIGACFWPAAFFTGPDWLRFAMMGWVFIGISDSKGNK